MLVVSVFTITGILCSCHKNSEPLIEEESGMLNISFQIKTSLTSPSTKADDQDHLEVGSEYRAFEEAINIDDVAIWLFVAINDDDQKVLINPADIQEDSDSEIQISGWSGLYTVALKLKKEKLKEVLGTSLGFISDDDKIKLRLLILANSSKTDSTPSATYGSLSGESFIEVIEELEERLVEMSAIYNPEGDKTAEGLFPTTGKLIPMFGTSVKEINKGALTESSVDQSYYLGEIDLLRALAKVRVVDNIAGKDAAGYPKISGVEFISSQDKVKVLPYQAATYNNGNQVHNSNIAEPDNLLKIEDSPIYTMGTIPDSWNMTPSNQRKGDTMIAYVPEQKIGARQSGTAGGMPIFRITVATGKDASGVEMTTSYDVAMTSYGDTTFKFGDNILRNHIYTLSVSGIGDEDLVVKARITPWVYDRTHIDWTEE